MTPLDMALDALEAMVTQFLPNQGNGEYSDLGVFAGQEACDVLATLRPDKWERLDNGIRWLA